jgi:DNA-binding NarL/FixJ family response regulator
MGKNERRDFADKPCGKKPFHFKKRLEAFGFGDVTVTALDKDALYSLVRELKPDLVLMGARFYHCCTPFMMGALRKTFPKVKMAAVCLDEYPADIAMYFILNGINSYVTYFDGVDQFHKGLEEIAKGKEYVSPEVVERINMRREKPDPAGIITERHKRVIRLICCGFKEREIADVLAVSRNTVVNHKTDIFTALNVRSPVELVRTVLTLEILRLEELYFYPKDFTVNPLPKKNIKGRGK